MGLQALAWKLAEKGINTIAGDAATTFVYHSYTGTSIPDPNNPSASLPAYTQYAGIKGILNPSVRGEASGEYMLESRERFRRSIRLLIARKDLPFTPTVTDNPKSRDKIELADGTFWHVIEVSPGDPTGATFNLIGSRQS